MSDNPGGCVTCGRSYKRWEFRIDVIGRAILEHRCVADDIERFQRSECLARTKYTQVRRYQFVCDVCHKTRMGTHIQRFCDDCREGYRKECDRVRMASKRLRGVA